METILDTPAATVRTPLDAVKAHRVLMLARSDLRRAASLLVAATSISITPNPDVLASRVEAVTAAHLNVIAATAAYAEARS